MNKLREKKNNILAVIAITAVILMLATLFFTQEGNDKLPRDKDNEFKNGSGIQISALSDIQTESLYKLCKVWGYTKYYHPSVISGDLNWDAELFRVMPQILDSENSTETNTILLNWLEQFPFKIQKTETAAALKQLQEEIGQQLLDTSWIEDTTFLGNELSSYLCKLSQNLTSDRENSYAAFEYGTVSFEHEKMYPVADGDSGMQLLGLFRFWNIYEYYSPNVEITLKNWDDVLKESIPKIATAQDYRSYVLALAKTTAMTGDAHLDLIDKNRTLSYYYGKYFLPCSINMIDGQAVVEQTDVMEKLQPGDILLEIDGISIENRIKELSQYFALPQSDKILLQMQGTLLQAKGKTTEVIVLRNNTEVTLQVATNTSVFQQKNPFKNGILEGEEIGYIDPSALKEGDLEKLMKEFQNTRGIIVDLRYYPSVFIPYLLGEYIISEPKAFAIMGMPNPAIPGAFLQQTMSTGKGIMKEMYHDDREFDEYNGKVIILMDESSGSQSEFTTMALRQSPNAVVIGSPSWGADGNVVKLSLPGQIHMYISGLGVYTPEGGQTQRCGLTPDVECYPTVEGLRAKRDELIEKAVEIINQN